MIAAWTDGKWFQTSVGVIFGALGDKVPDAFKKDREKMSGRPFDTGVEQVVRDLGQVLARHAEFAEASARGERDRVHPDRVFGQSVVGSLHECQALDSAGLDLWEQPADQDVRACDRFGWVPTPEYSNWSQRWLDHYDAESTFESYGVEFGNLSELADRVPAVHRDFLAGLPWCVEHPRFLFVHAGLDANAPFEVQMRILRQRDFTLNRPQWLCSKSIVDSDGPPDCPLTIVSGHVYVPQVEIRSKRILVDTTGGSGGDLSCLLLPEKKVIASGADMVAAGGGKSWWKLW